MAAKTAIKEPKRSSALVRRETFASYCFLLPSLIFFLGFVIYPMVLCVVTSFFDSTMNRADIFVGLANYKELFTDPIFLGALKNTFIIVVVSVPVTCAFSLWVSSAIVDLPEWATSLFRCVFYLPVVTGSVAVTVVWKWMYNNYYGIFNYLGKTLGLIDKNINWLGDERFALGCIILILLTTSVASPSCCTFPLWVMWTSPSWKPQKWTVPPISSVSGRSSGPPSCPPPCTFWSLPPSTPSSASR